jgi:hypothetical protein
MPKLVILIPFYKRHDLTRVVFRHYKLMQQRCHEFQIELLAVGSERETSRKLAGSEGLDYLECENLPLDVKYERGFQAVAEFDPDAVCLVGSNDMISFRYFTAAFAAINGGTADNAGLLDCFLVDQNQKRILYWGGYTDKNLGLYQNGPGSRKGESIASGRMFGRELLKKMNHRPFEAESSPPQAVFNDDERNLDCMHKHGARIQNWMMKDLGCTFWNIKTDFDLNPINAFESNAQHSIQDVTNSQQEFWRFFSELEQLQDN